jgi:protein-disulfide isomerase
MPILHRLRHLGLPFLAAVLLLVGTAPSARAANFSDPQKSDIEAIVKAYLLAHPEVVVDALGEYDKRQKMAETEQAGQAIAENRAEILSDKGGGVAGNPKGNITLVEFFDYRCGYCKKARPIVAELLKSDPQLRLVYKELPILGPDSLVASKAALAARAQGTDKYIAFHEVLMDSRGAIDENAIKTAARQVGLDVAKLTHDMNDPAIEATLKATNALATKLGITGTPSFVIGDTLIPGYAELEQLVAMVADARKACKGAC